MSASPAISHGPGLERQDRAVLPFQLDQLYQYGRASAGVRGGAILLTTDMSGPVPRSAFADPYTATIPIFLVNESIAHDLLTGAGHTLDTSSNSPSSRRSPRRCISPWRRQSRVEARNVLGLLPVPTRLTKDEFVIIGAPL